jgi:hypothetical protein
MTTKDDEFGRALRHTEDVINRNFHDLFARVKALEERFDRLEADLSEMVRRRFE